MEAESKEQELKSSKRNLDELTSLLKGTDSCLTLFSLPYMNCVLTETFLWTANIDAINNFTRKMENLKRQRDDFKVTFLDIVLGFPSGLTIFDFTDFSLTDS
jgi:structural maintenance of chromosome 3 (chondroitin sulfate proteoglycan 6)